jgi:hypothetical protein
MPIPISKKTSAAIEAILAERGIEYWPRVLRLDPERHVAHVEGDRELAYDLFLGIPVHKAPDVVLESGLAEGGSRSTRRRSQPASTACSRSATSRARRSPERAASPGVRHEPWPTC